VFHKDTTKIEKLKEQKEAELKQQLPDKLKLKNQRILRIVHFLKARQHQV
jgi:D-serine dehydratase